MTLHVSQWNQALVGNPRETSAYGKVVLPKHSATSTVREPIELVQPQTNWLRSLEKPIVRQKHRNTLLRT